MYGGGANAWAGAAATAGGGGAAHLVFGMNGRGAGSGAVGFWGRPTSAVAHVPTHRSNDNRFCARRSGSARTSRKANAIAATAAALERWTRCLVSSLMAGTSFHGRNTGGDSARFYSAADGVA